MRQRIAPRDLVVGDRVIWFDGALERIGTVTRVRKTRTHYGTTVYRYALSGRDYVAQVVPSARVEVERDES